MSRGTDIVMDPGKYTEFDPFLDCDRDVKIEGRRVKVVKTRKVHICLTPALRQHEIPVGSLARFESAIVDGEPGCFYTCLECCDYLMRKGAECRICCGDGVVMSKPAGSGHADDLAE